jgi:anaerobic ribonucleoside-triphosphate reductase activating protein
MTFQIHSRIELSHVNGPGRRAVIWLQGCSLACSGCWNLATQSRSGGTEEGVEHVHAWVHRLWSAGAIDGLTISGGEPLEQAPALVEFVETLRGSLPALSLGLFSGYSERELESGRYRSFPEVPTAAKRRIWSRVKACLDFAVLGRFNERQPSSAPLVSSKNQRLRLYSDRYTSEDLSPQSVEVTIDSLGLAQITGFPVRYESLL